MARCVERAQRDARDRPGNARVDRAPHLLKLRLHGAETYSPGYGPSMPSLVLGPLLRYVGETEAVLWVETDSACEVEILGTRERTFCVCGHHYALVCCGDLEPGSWHEYEVQLDGERVWPRDGRLSRRAPSTPTRRRRRSRSRSAPAAWRRRTSRRTR